MSVKVKWSLVLSTILLVVSVTTSCTTISGRRGPAVDESQAKRPAAEAVDKNKVQRHFRLAQQHFKAEAFDEAQAEIQIVLTLDPQQPVPHLLSGDIFYAQTKFEKALQEYNQAAALDKNRGLPHVKIARAHVKLDRLDKALASYQTAIRIEPEVAVVYREYAGLCRQMGLKAEARQAEEKLQRLIASRQKSGQDDANMQTPAVKGHGALNLDRAIEKIVRLADEFYRDDLLSLALEQYRMAAVRVPQNVLVQQKLGDAYARKGMLTEAISQYQRVVALQPDIPFGYLGLGVVYSKMLDIQTARDFFEKGLLVAPDFIPLRLELAHLYYKADQLDGAIAELEKIMTSADFDSRPAELLEKIKAEKEAEAGFAKIETEHFVLKYDPRQEEKFINYTLSAIKEAYQKLRADLAYRPQHKMVVKLYPGLKAFHRAASTPEWFRSGVASAKDYKVLLATPRKKRNILKFPQVVTHELTHVFTNLITYGKHPSWIHEGLATFEAGQWNAGKEKVLREAFFDDRLFRLEELDKPFTRLKKPEQIRLAYAQSCAVVNYIMDIYGRQKLLNVLHAFSRGQDFDEAATAVFGVDAGLFEEQWRGSMRRRYGA